MCLAGCALPAAANNIWSSNWCGEKCGVFELTNSHSESRSGSVPVSPPRHGFSKNVLYCHNTHAFRTGYVMLLWNNIYIICWGSDKTHKQIIFLSHMQTLPVMRTLLVLVHRKQLLCLSSHLPAVRPKFSSARWSHRLLTVWGQITKAGPGPAVIGHFPTANTHPQGPFPFLCQQNTSSWLINNSFFKCFFYFLQICSTTLLYLDAWNGNAVSLRCNNLLRVKTQKFSGGILGFEWIIFQHKHSCIKVKCLV